MASRSTCDTGDQLQSDIHQYAPRLDRAHGNMVSSLSCKVFTDYRLITGQNYFTEFIKKTALQQIQL